MMRVRKKIIGLSLLTVLLFTGVVVNAASVGSFSFKFNTAVYGSTVFSLKNKDTTVTSTANTYKYADDKANSTKRSYKIALPKSGSSGTFYTAGTAAGVKRTVNFGKKAAGSYKVNLMFSTPQPSGAVYLYIKGSGNVNQ